MNKGKAYVFIDTNFWLIPYKYKIDIFSELERILLRKYEIIISNSIVRELENIQKNLKKKGEDRIAAKIGIELIKRKKVKKVGIDIFQKIFEKNDGRDVDSLILKISEILTKKGYDFIVCTNDKKLRKKLIEKNEKIKIIGMKEKNKLDFI